MVQGGKNVIVFYGSQTGTAEDFANRLAREAGRFGLRAAVTDPEDCDMEETLKLMKTDHSVAIFCMASYGEGDPTDNARDFHNWLQGANEANLNGVRYTVFGLGNKTYQNFNVMGKYVDMRLAELGATRLHEIGLGDDNGNIEDNFNAWKDEMWVSICSHLGVSVDRSTGSIRQYRLDTVSDVRSDKIFKGEVARLGAFDKQRPPFDIKNPFLAKFVQKKELNKGGNRKCISIELDITGSRLKYECGDHVGVLPSNDPEQVEQLAKLLNVDLNQVFSLVAIDSDNNKRNPFPCPTTYRTAFTHYIDINNPLKTNLLGDLSVYASDPKEAEFLKSLSLTDGKNKYEEWILGSRRNIVAVLEDLRSLKVPADHLLEILPRLQVRYYSISSSPKLYPNAIYITASVVDFTTQTGRRMKGVATNYLYRMQPLESGAPRVPIYVRRSQFKLPYKSKTPIIMVGPGTGVAPFRGFIEERTVAKNAGKLIGETILYFGCRKQTEDFLYEEELKRAETDGVLSNLYLAFSRDQENKIYVQHLMKQEKNKEQIWNIINNGGHVYICGDAKNMARDVGNVLLEIMQSEAGMSGTDAEEYLKTMKIKGRYELDVWS